MDNGEQTLRMIVLASPEPMPTLVEPQPKDRIPGPPGLAGNFAGRNPKRFKDAFIGQASPSRSVPGVTRAEVEGRVGHPSGTAMNNHPTVCKPVQSRGGGL